MKNKLIYLLEDIKAEKYSNYSNYLNSSDIDRIKKWYNSFALKDFTDFETIISLMFDLYIREDIDLRPYEDYKIITDYLANKYQFNSRDFLDIYKSFRDLLFYYENK